MISREVEVLVKVGLHARPAAEFAKVASEADFIVLVSRLDGQAVKANSPLRLLTLKIKQGEKIRITCGTDNVEEANKLIDRLVHTITND